MFVHHDLELQPTLLTVTAIVMGIWKTNIDQETRLHLLTRYTNASLSNLPTASSLSGIELATGAERANYIPG